MALFGSFLKGAPGSGKQSREATERVKEWARAALGGAEEIAFAVNEIACTDPSCPGVETIILVMEPGEKTRACKIGKMLDDVSEEDVRAALA
ncbi:hypothetical protein [Microvirga flavescens]|uniref:hypothetical protein n=1 Tax=Microvirga flavescens TaxID=2249811 RepID=UPI001FDF0463|nr:hypothetical protein [Microvirga flavescens]